MIIDIVCASTRPQPPTPPCLEPNDRFHIDFDFHDAHDLRPLTDRASDETVRQRLRARFSNAKQVIVLIGEQTKYLYKFVRW